MEDMSAHDSLSPGQFSDPHIQNAVEELALSHRAWTGTPEPLSFTSESVRPSSVRFQRYPHTDPRVHAAIEGATPAVLPCLRWPWCVGPGRP